MRHFSRGDTSLGKEGQVPAPSKVAQSWAGLGSRARGYKGKRQPAQELLQDQSLKVKSLVQPGASDGVHRKGCLKHCRSPPWAFSPPCPPPEYSQSCKGSLWHSAPCELLLSLQHRKPRAQALTSSFLESLISGLQRQKGTPRKSPACSSSCCSYVAVVSSIPAPSHPIPAGDTSTFGTCCFLLPPGDSAGHKLTHLCHAKTAQLQSPSWDNIQ